MKAYGLRRRDELDDFALPTRERKHTSNFRKTSRRRLHKQARNDAKKDLRSST